MPLVLHLVAGGVHAVGLLRGDGTNQAISVRASVLPEAIAS